MRKGFAGTPPPAFRNTRTCALLPLSSGERGELPEFQALPKPGGEVETHAEKPKMNSATGPEAKLQENSFPDTTRNCRRKSSARATGGCRRFAIAALFLAGSITPAAGADAPCDAAFVQKVQESYRALRSFSASFRQEDHRRDGEVRKAAGTVSFFKPGRMRWSYDPPNEQLIVTDGKTVWLFDPLLENVTVQPLQDLTRGTPLAFLLGVGDLARDFACEPFTRPPPADGLAYLELHPRSEIPALAYVQLGVRRSDARIGALRMVDTDGGMRLILLRDFRTGITFPADYFTFKVTEGMEVISK